MVCFVSVSVCSAGLQCLARIPQDFKCDSSEATITTDELKADNNLFQSIFIVWTVHRHRHRHRHVMYDCVTLYSLANQISGSVHYALCQFD